MFINCRRHTCCSDCNVVANECNEIVQPISAHGGEVMYLVSFCFSGKLGFM